MANTSKRIVELDSLRGIAAIFVMIYHYFYRFDVLYKHPHFETKWASIGVFGVELFFLISGFVIFWSIRNIKKNLPFLISRFTRLYPTFWVAIIISFTLVCIFGLPGREVSIKEMFLNFFMFHGYLNIPSVDGVYWTLMIELSFYFWIFLLLILKKTKQIDYFLILFLIPSLCYNLDFFHCPDKVASFFLLKYISFFSIGIFFYKLKTNQCKTSTYIAFTLAFITSLCTSKMTYIPIILFIHLLFFISIKEYSKILRSRVLVFLGNISYPLYLIHQNLGYIIIREFYKNDFNPLLGILLAFVFSILLAWAIHTSIEKPSSKYLKKRLLSL